MRRDSAVSFTDFLVSYRYSYLVRIFLRHNTQTIYSALYSVSYALCLFVSWALLPVSLPSFLPTFSPAYPPSLFSFLPTVDSIMGFAHAAGFAAARRSLWFIVLCFVNCWQLCGFRCQPPVRVATVYKVTSSFRDLNK